MRCKKRFDWDIHDPDKKGRLEKLSKYHGVIRKDLLYIYGDSRLWYLKKDIPTNGHLIKRNSVTLLICVMHWLSEPIRYNPGKFEMLMKHKAELVDS